MDGGNGGWGRMGPLDGSHPKGGGRGVDAPALLASPRRGEAMAPSPDQWPDVAPICPKSVRSEGLTC